MHGFERRFVVLVDAILVLRVEVFMEGGVDGLGGEGFEKFLELFLGVVVD